MQVRKLKAKDLYTVGAMLRRAAPEVSKLPEMQRVKGSESTDTDRSAVGQAVVGALLRTCYDDAWAWLADMACMDVDEFNEQPLDAPLQVVESIAKGDDFGDFWRRALELIGSN